MNLEDLLKARVKAGASDARALTAVIEAGRGTRILFGAIGDLPRIILGVEGNKLSLIYPPADDPEAARDFILADLAGEAIPAEGAEDLKGEFIAFPINEPVPGYWDEVSETLYAGEGGPEIDLPDNFFEFTARAFAEATAEKTDPETSDATAPEQGQAPAGETTDPATTPAQPEENGSTGSAQQDDPPPVEPVNPDSMGKPELIDLGRKTPGAEFNDTDTKKVIADAINKARGL